MLASNPEYKKPLELQEPLSINPQPESPLFTLPAEIRIIIYQFLFGKRPIHYEREWTNEKKKQWAVYSFVCYAECKRLDWDFCAGSSRGASDVPRNYWGMYIDLSLLYSCWRVYVTRLLRFHQTVTPGLSWKSNKPKLMKNSYLEGLPILYGNEFRFSAQRELCNTFPAQMPASGLRHVRRVTLWWPLGNALQPHVSTKNRENYDSLWKALGSKYHGLTHIRIYIDSPYLAGMVRMPRGFPGNIKPGDAEFDQVQLIQSAWLEGIEAMIKENTDLAFFEVYFYTKVYQVLRKRVKPFLNQMQEDRGGNKPVSYKAYKCRSTAIKRACCAGSPENTDISDGSSHMGIEHPQSRPADWWIRKLQENKRLQEARRIENEKR